MNNSEHYDFVVLGAGSGGVRAARIAATLGAKVALIEKHKIGGTCVNAGCVPKKLFAYAAQLHLDMIRSPSWGYAPPNVDFDWKFWIDFVVNEIKRLNGLYEENLKKAGVDIYQGFGTVNDAHNISVQLSNGSKKQLFAQKLLLATGTKPRVIDIPGQEYWITSDHLFSLPTFPKRLFIYGGGYIAVEVASLFASWGSQVVLVSRSAFLKGFEPDIVARVYTSLDLLKVESIVNDKVKKLAATSTNAINVELESGRIFECDVALCATGREIRENEVGIERLKLEKNSEDWFEVNENFQTSNPNVFAVGDITGYFPLTPVAIRQGESLARYLFQKDFVMKKINYDLVPTAVYSIPAIGTVGLTEQQAREQGFTVKVFKTEFLPMKFAPHRNQAIKSLMKLNVCAKTDRILGFHMIGYDAPEIMQGMAVALQSGITKAQLNETIGIHPTSAEEWVTL